MVASTEFEDDGEEDEMIKEDDDNYSDDIDQTEILDKAQDPKQNDDTRAEVSKV